MLHAEDADLLSRGHARDGIGHVQADALLADHDGADICGCRKLDEMVHWISEEDLDALAFHDFRDRRSHFHVDELPSLPTYTKDGFTCRMLPALPLSVHSGTMPTPRP